MKQGLLTEHDAFIMGAKETIIEMISGQKNADLVTEFVLHEADDNQIMSLLLVQEMPNDDNDYTLTEDYNTLVESGIIFETEYFTKQNYIEFMQEMELYGGLPRNYEQIIESFLLEVDPMDRMASDPGWTKYQQRPGGAGADVGRASGKTEFTKIAEAQKTLKNRLLNMMRSINRNVKALPGRIWSMAKSAFQAAIRAGQKPAAAIQRGIAAVGKFIKAAATGAKAGFGAAKDFGGSKIAGAVKGAVRGVKGADAFKISTAQAADVAKGQKAAAARAAKMGKITAPIKKAAGSVKGGVMKGVGAVKGAAIKAGTTVGKHWKPLGAAAALAAASGASYQAYKRYFSAAAKACAGKSGAEKDACMDMARKKAVQARIAALKASIAQCSKSSNPEGCKSAIMGKIQSLQAKAA